MKNEKRKRVRRVEEVGKAEIDLEHPTVRKAPSFLFPVWENQARVDWLSGDGSEGADRQTVWCLAEG